MYVSLLVRVVVILVMWKISHNFRKFIRNVQEVKEKAPGGDIEKDTYEEQIKIENIINVYKATSAQDNLQNKSA